LVKDWAYEITASITVCLTEKEIYIYLD